MIIDGLAVNNNQLIRFLNGEGSDQLKQAIEQTEDWKEIQKTLIRCVNRIVKYKKDWMDREKAHPDQLFSNLPDESRLLMKRASLYALAESLYGDIWTNLHTILSECKLVIYPGTVYGEEEDMIRFMRESAESVAKPGGVEQLPVRYRVYPNKREIPEISDLKKVFSPNGFLLFALPITSNYALAFLNLLSDPNQGIEKIFRCDYCGKIGLATYKRIQLFCSKSQCSANYHNQKKAPKMAEYMRKYRKVRKKLGKPFD